MFDKIPDGKVDLILTDPPYGMNYQSNWSKNGPRHEKIKSDNVLDLEWLKDAYRVLSNDHGGIVLFCNWGTSREWQDELEKVGFKIKSQVIWDRQHHGMGDLKGSFAPQHDIIWYAVKKKARRIFMNGRPKSILSYKRPSPSQDNGHPTCKPVELMKELFVSVQCKDVETVFDPFMGSGSTGVAIKKLGQKFIGCEIEKK